MELESADLRGADLRKVRFGRALLADADLRGSDLRECSFGADGESTGLTRARIGRCAVQDASGGVSGPIDVGADQPRLIDGADLARWFADHGAPGVVVRE